MVTSIFIYLSATVLSALSKLPQFQNVISRVSLMDPNKCVSFLRASRILFASYAVPSKVFISFNNNKNLFFNNILNEYSSVTKHYQQLI